MNYLNLMKEIVREQVPISIEYKQELDTHGTEIISQCLEIVNAMIEEDNIPYKEWASLRELKIKLETIYNEYSIVLNQKNET